MAGSFYSQIQLSTPFAGSASDPGTNPTGVSTVTIAVLDRLGRPILADGSGFNSGSILYIRHLQARPQELDRSPNANLNFTGDRQYDVTARATDNASNTSSTTVRFTYDVQIPTSAITSPVGGFNTGWTTVSGNTNDPLTNPSGVPPAGVQLAVKDTSNNWWNGANFTGLNPLWTYFTITNTTTTMPNTWTVTLDPTFKAAIVKLKSYFRIGLARDRPRRQRRNLARLAATSRLVSA